MPIFQRNEEGGWVAVPTSFSIFDSYDMKCLLYKFGYIIITGFKMASPFWDIPFSAVLRNESEDL